MTDLILQKFSNRIDAAVTEGTLTAQDALMAKAALEGGGIDAAMETLRTLVKADGAPADSPAAVAQPEAPPEPVDDLAEDKADLRDELNRDLGSPRAVELIRKIAMALPDGRGVPPAP